MLKHFFSYKKFIQEVEALDDAMVRRLYERINGTSHDQHKANSPTHCANATTSETNQDVSASELVASEEET
ncbi:hypothetical protein [Vagococcus xieshaowenii]|uniref:Uncharacterized protein n=1 Tax=Vagococcus xieshaowenii TaxID=2562451 RepID=A0AAJ5EDG8_9ENTE|nr:hypothetical protein [Vagococcus xieshaowenii]QCA29451.1 hypothetical protein E4Z98_09025 [Vagococcus xieshaowenii]TFZ39622.1 hypothetical protein E4031_08715 [Vagococcus xieshaowenii]